MPAERHAWAPGVEDDQYNRFISRHSPMEGVDCLRDRLSGRKALLLAIFFPLKHQFSGDDVGRAWHRMTMPFKLSVRWETDFQYCQLRPARRVRLVRLTVPGRATV